MKSIFLYLMIALYVMAGINHFLNTRMYLKIVPAWVPAHLTTVYVSGILEILFALLLIWPATRIMGAWFTIALLIVIFPANIKMAIDYQKQADPYLWVAVLRLPCRFP